MGRDINKKREYDKKYYLNNSEKVKRINALWKEKNKERLIKYRNERYKQNREIILYRQKLTYKKRYEKNKVTISTRNKNRWIRYKNEMYGLLGGKKCKSCGFEDERALAIDHVFNDGYKERKLEKSISQMRKRVFATPNRYQILCYNCNQIKKYENQNREIAK